MDHECIVLVRVSVLEICLERVVRGGLLGDVIALVVDYSSYTQEASSSSSFVSTC